MKVCSGTKTSPYHLVTTAILVLTFFLGFSSALDGQQTYKVNKVVLDAGHGGKDPGCHGHNTKEKDVALAITLELGRRIKASFPDVEVIYTRECDKFIALNERAAIANKNKADLFISIHCNYIGSRNRATGTETYVLGLHRAEDNLDVAKRENASILLEDNFEKTYDGFDPYSPEGHIILSMFQNAHLHQSIALANSIESAFRRLSHLPSRGVKQAGFLVLRETTMPSVLIETGFLSTDADENFLMKKENQDKVADAIFKAFCQYKKDVDEHQKEIQPVTNGNETITSPPAIVVSSNKEANSKASENTQSGNAATLSKTPSSKSDSNQLLYRIQVAASSKSTIDSRYHSLDDLEVIREDALYKFIVGQFSTREDALIRLKSLQESGFQGAFITVYKGGQRVKA